MFFEQNCIEENYFVNYYFNNNNNIFFIIYVYS